MATVKGLSEELMALRAVQELEEGMYVNLGTGLPDLILDVVPPEKEIIFHNENGVLGIDKISDDESKWDDDLVNVSGYPILVHPGASCFDACLSFGMMRGGRIDVAIVGGYQVSKKGDLANWKLAGQKVGAPGGAMDLAAGAKKVIVLMKHVTKSNRPRIVNRCSLPLTGKKAVHTMITDYAVIDVTEQGLLLREIAPGLSVQMIRDATEPELILSDRLKETAF